MCTGWIKSSKAQLLPLYRRPWASLTPGVELVLVSIFMATRDVTRTIQHTQTDFGLLYRRISPLITTVFLLEAPFFVTPHAQKLYEEVKAPLAKEIYPAPYHAIVIDDLILQVCRAGAFAKPWHLAVAWVGSVLL
jgi:hypothetical protein